MGRIVPPRDAPALAEALIDVLNDPTRYGGDARAVREHYSSETVARHYEAIFKELSAPR
jgi:glycosyltransferase involved in cell wall biosynthesis